MPSTSLKMKALSDIGKNSLKIETLTFPVVCYFTRKLEFVSNIFVRGCRVEYSIKSLNVSEP